MAGGIDWFRWHHGSVTDPKFGLVARRAGARLSDVLAVWAFILEQASASDDRGFFGDVDCEAIDCLFGLDDGQTSEILAQMGARGLIEDQRISAWERRQPKREDETANDRKRRQREREHELKMSASRVTDAESRNVTQCHADVTPGHARGEERREEEKYSLRHTQSNSPDVLRASSVSGQICQAMKQEGISDVNPGHTDLLLLIEAGATMDEFVAAARSAAKKRKGFAYAIGTLKGMRQDAAKSAEGMPKGVLPSARASPSRADLASQTAALMTGAIPFPASTPQPLEIVEVIDEQQPRLAS